MSRAAGYSHAMMRRRTHSKADRLCRAIEQAYGTLARKSEYRQGAIRVDVCPLPDVRVAAFSVEFDPATPDDPAVYYLLITGKVASKHGRVGVDKALDRIAENCQIIRTFFETTDYGHRKALTLPSEVRACARLAQWCVVEGYAWRRAAGPDGTRDILLLEFYPLFGQWRVRFGNRQIGKADVVEKDMDLQTAIIWADEQFAGLRYETVDGNRFVVLADGTRRDEV